MAVLAGRPALAGITAFKQAVAEAAADDRDIAAFYRANGFEAVWTGEGEEYRARRSALLSAMDSVDLHGLPPARHDVARLIDTLALVRTPRERGFAEVAMSRAFIRLAREMQSGVLDPASIDEGIKRRGVYRDASTYLTGLVESRHPRAYIRTLVPQTREYTRLMKEKMHLEQVIARGGWGPTVPARALAPGDSGPAVVALRNRLMAMGYLERSVSAVYDDAIEDAVRRFQALHGLEEDGKAGSGTLAEINKSAATRLASVLVAMERERWLNTERGARHILVNLTDFSARIIDNDVITFETRAVVGANAPDRRSPEFSDEMEYLVINPSWNVPRSIAVNEYLPQLRANPGAAGHLRLYQGGREISRAGINFSAYTANTFPFDLKQPPSPGNALGVVKFMFPNKYNIYLHDTPAKGLFASARRAYSHGCIRLQQPREFAYEILSRQEADPEGFFARVLATGIETQVDLKEKIPVHIIYRTAFSDARGQMNYRPDVYGRDALIWEALKRVGIESPALQLASLEIPAPQYFPTPQAEPVNIAPAAYEPPAPGYSYVVREPVYRRAAPASGRSGGHVGPRGANR
ncbi:MAG: L,D-transpeptidase family protein [Roseovarius sp.]